MEHGASTTGNPGSGKDSFAEGPAAFSDDYRTARRRFLAAANRLGWEIKSYPHHFNGPGGEPLSTDVAISPGSRSDRALVVSSGLHGVEGFFGSAVQLGWMERCLQQPASPIRLVLIHALNPYGFAWRRRVNEDNVDLNRNFLREGEDYSGCPAGYAALDGFLNPRRPPSRWDLFMLKAMVLLARHGKAKLQQAIAVGQYKYPRGLFYGGDGPSRQYRLLSEHFNEWIGEARDVVHLDLHTGLGAPKQCHILVDSPLEDRLRERMQNWFGREVLEAYAAKKVNYQAKGGLGRWLTDQHPERDYSFAFVEFGTYGPVRMLKGLRAENQAYHWGEDSSPETFETRAKLMELFCPHNPAWRQSVLKQSLEHLEQAKYGLETAG